MYVTIKKMIQAIKNFFHGYEARLANLFYGRPARKIFTIGVTGTDGKTTTTSLIFHILKIAGKNPAMLTSVGAQIGEKEYETGLHTTTPSAFSLQKYIKRVVEAKCNYLVLEVTSHALDQNRVRGIAFKIGVLTNITHEHLDYHKTYENYVSAKSKLFRISEVAVLNKDDKSYALMREKSKNRKVYTYSLKGPADFTIKNIGIQFSAKDGPASGWEFNFENFLAAVAVAKILEIDDEKIKLALSTFKFPEGRQEIVYDKDFKVIIDFAHTPNSFKRVLPALKKTSSGRLIHVFGSAGQRDASKRPLMGEISAEFSDVIILTSEDPRSEKIEDINQQIKIGMKNFKGELFEIPDRQYAIDFAIKMAKSGGTVVITGKGHEKSMNLGNGEISWSEHAAVERALKLVNRE